jgi:hypothetical protein
MPSALFTFVFQYLTFYILHEFVEQTLNSVLFEIAVASAVKVNNIKLSLTSELPVAGTSPPDFRYTFQPIRFPFRLQN